MSATYDDDDFLEGAAAGGKHDGMKRALRNTNPLFPASWFEALKDVAYRNEIIITNDVRVWWEFKHRYQPELLPHIWAVTGPLMKHLEAVGEIMWLSRVNHSQHPRSHGAWQNKYQVINLWGGEVGDDPAITPFVKHYIGGRIVFFPEKVPDEIIFGKKRARKIKSNKEAQSEY